MTKIVALHTVVHGKAETALPNTPFEVDEATAAELIACGAAREPTEAEVALWPTVEATAASTKKRGRKKSESPSDEAADEGGGDEGADDEGGDPVSDLT